MKHNFKFFFSKVFTRRNFTKVLIIFFVGLISRILINHYFSINVFVDYFSLVSSIYYFFMSSFIVFIHEFVEFFNFIIPSFSFITISFKSFFTNIKLLVYEIFNGKIRNNKIIYLDDDSPDSLTFGVRFHDDSNNGSFVSHNSSEININSPNRISNSRIFYDEFGRPYISATPNSIPATPNMSNFSTPETMTPLFQSTESLSNPNNPINNPSLYPRPLMLPGNVAYYPANVFYYPTNYNSSMVVSTQRNSATTSYGTEASYFTNGTNHATVGYNESIDHNPTYNTSWNANNVDWNVHRNRINVGIQENLVGYSSKEVVIESNKIKGKLKLGFGMFDDIETVYVKYHDLAKRKFYWKIWEKNRGNYETYSDFKANFDPKTNIWKDIWKATKSDLSKEIRGIIGRDHPFESNRVRHRNIRQIGVTSTQNDLNNINSTRYGAKTLHTGRKLVKIRRS